MKYYHINPNTYDGFLFQIPFYKPLPWEVINWCHEDSDNRRTKISPYKTAVPGSYVELKVETDLAYFILKWS